jgi:hypothetical protein
MRAFEAAALVEVALPKARRVAARPIATGCVGRTLRTRDAHIVQTRRLPAVVLSVTARRRRNALLFRAGLLERIVPLFLTASGRFYTRRSLSALYRFCARL